MYTSMKKSQSFHLFWCLNYESKRHYFALISLIVFFDTYNMSYIQILVFQKKAYLMDSGFWIVFYIIMWGNSNGDNYSNANTRSTWGNSKRGDNYTLRRKWFSGTQREVSTCPKEPIYAKIFFKI